MNIDDERAVGWFKRVEQLRQERDEARADRERLTNELSELREQMAAQERRHLATIRERDRWIRLFNRLENAITHHQRDATETPYDVKHVEPYDEALWKARDRLLSEAGERRDPLMDEIREFVNMVANDSTDIEILCHSADALLVKLREASDDPA